MEQKITDPNIKEALAKFLEEKFEVVIDAELLSACVRELRAGRAVLYRVDRTEFKIIFEHQGEIQVIESSMKTMH